MVAKLPSGRSCRRRRLLLEQLEDRLNLAALSVSEAFAFEGDSGIAETGFTVTLDQASSETVTVNYFTFGDSATSNVDFAQTSETIVFEPGQTSQSVGVAILGDTEIEPDETFYFVLDSPAGAGLADDYYALGTIGNDDSTPGNNAPIATAEAYELNEDHILQVYNLGVLANDYDPEGDPLQAFVTSGPAHGTLLLDAGGSFNYIPDQDYFGPDSFTYRARDLGGLSGLATVSLTVWGMDDPIQLVPPGSQTTEEEAPLTFSIANDNRFTITDVESPPVMVGLLVQNGILTLTNTAGLEFPDPNSTNNNSYITFYADNPAEANAALDGLIFTPTADFHGATYLDVMVTDTSIIYYQETAYATVPIDVGPVNDAPTAAADLYETGEDVPLMVDGFGVLANDYDIDYDSLSAVLVSGPAHGAVTLNPGGSFTYTPAANFNGTDSFTYAATDPGGLSTTATATITVWQMNDPLQVAVPAPQTVVEDGSITFSAAGGNAFTVSDLEAPSLIVALVVQDGILTLPSTAGLEFPYSENTNNSSAITFYADNPAEANVALEGLVFTPNANFNGQVSLSLFAQDTSFVSFPAQEAFDYTTITVTPVNDAPVAVDDFYTAEAGAPFVATQGGGGGDLGVLANDQDVDMEQLTAILVSGPAHGMLELNADGTFTYTADAAYTGTDSFTYRASDGQVESGLATATFTVIQSNDPPVAGNDSYSVAEDGVLTMDAPGILDSDSDADGDTLTAALVNGPSHGVLNLSADGSFTYTPAANYHGSDSFTYRAHDGESDSNVATVSITVSAVNDAPLAVDDAYSVNEDQTLTIAPVPGVTSLTMVSEPGDYIGQGQSYSFTPATGTFFANRNFDNGVSIFYSGSGHSWHLDFAAPLSVDLTPGHYANATRWPFQASSVPGLNVSGDGRGSNTLTGNFTVTQALYAADGKVLRFAGDFEQHSEGFAPALTGTIRINEGEGPSGILLNDSDVESNPLTIIVVSGPAHGTLSMNVDGSFIYKPTDNYNGADSFRYKLTDGTSESNVATVTLTVNAINDFPTAVADSYTVAEDSVLSVAAPGVLANDSDVDGQSLTATLVTSPTHGSLAFHSDGSFTYTPHANYHGSDSFQYAARDGSSFSFIRTVTLNVTSVNDAPVATNDSYTTAEDTPLTVAAAGVLANDSDAEGSALSAILVSGPDHGTLNLNADGSFTYTPIADYNGTDSFTYQASDGSADSNVAMVSLTIAPVNDAPAVDAGSDQTVDEGAAVAFAAAATDGDGDTLSYLWDFGDGATSTDAAPTHVFADNGVYSVTLTVSDGQGGETAAELAVTVNNVAPTASLSGLDTGVRGQTRTFALAAADPAASDQAASFTFHIDWGDGSIEMVGGPASHQLGHTYADAGAFIVQITATDKDGGASVSAQHTIQIKAVDLQSGALMIGGTSGDDSITVAPTDSSGTLAVTINGVSQGTFAPPAQIVAYGQSGNDQIKLNTKKIGPTSYYVTSPAVLFGDDGDDTLDARGSSANNVLVGGTGGDLLQGGSGRDLLIGGLGGDTLRGNGGEDLVIGNSTDYDANLLALMAIMAEWGRTDADYNTRVNHVSGSASGGLNGETLLNTDTVHDEAVIDQLYGNAGSDWFFYTASGSNKDKLNDLVSGEVATLQ